MPNKTKVLLLVMLLALSLAAAVTALCGGAASPTISGYLRLHIRANSDFPADQELKMTIRNTVLQTLEAKLHEAGNMAEAEIIVVQALPEVVWQAASAVRRAGFDYVVNARLSEADFPTRTYGDLIFHAGRYKALAIDLGEGGGQNWWCVLFPPLCFVELTQEEFIQGAAGKTVSLTPRSRLLEWWGRRSHRP